MLLVRLRPRLLLRLLQLLQRLQQLQLLQLLRLLRLACLCRVSTASVASTVSIASVPSVASIASIASLASAASTAPIASVASVASIASLASATSAFLADPGSADHASDFVYADPSDALYPRRTLVILLWLALRMLILLVLFQPCRLSRSCAAAPAPACQLCSSYSLRYRSKRCGETFGGTDPETARLSQSLQSTPASKPPLQVGPENNAMRQPL